MFLNMVKSEDDAKEYISETEDRMESMLRPSSNTKTFLLDHEDKVTRPIDWWKTQSHGKTDYDVTTYSRIPCRVTYNWIY